MTMRPTAGAYSQCEGREGAGSEIGPLCSADLPDVLRLHAEVHAAAPYGHLAPRVASEIRAILDGDDVQASVGAWAPGPAGGRGRLVAYSLCTVDREPALLQGPVLRALQARGAPLWTGKGTVVATGHEGRLLMPRLLRARGRALRQAGRWNTAGLIATTNLASLVGALRTGSWVVGLENDALCDNFVCYYGELSPLALLPSVIRVPVRDLASIAHLLADGWVGTALDGKPRGHERYLLFRRLPQGWEDRP